MSKPVVFTFALLFLGCGANNDPDGSAAVDAAPDVPVTPDSSSTPPDATPDADPDAGTDADMDAATDADAAADVGVDAAPLCVGDIAECHPMPSVDYRCGGSCPEACGTAAQCSTCPSEPMPAAIRAYFTSLALPVVDFGGTLLHCGAARCGVTADFNGDGTDDYAGMYHYTGGDRGGSWELELVIIYSDGAGGYENVRYPYFGRIIGGVAETYILLQSPGLVVGHSTMVTLDYPGIRVYRVGVVGDGRGCYLGSQVYYWDDGLFGSVDLAPIP